jgi:hypothetical protein
MNPALVILQTKALPTRDLQTAAETEPLILNDQFYFVSELGPR